jgi:hypothetical protein
LQNGSRLFVAVHFLADCRRSSPTTQSGCDYRPAFGLPSLFDQVMKLRATIVKEVQEQL